MPTTASLRSRAGFTLAEVLAALVIMGILLAIAAPRMTGIVQSAGRGSVTNQLAADLSLTRMRAMRAGNRARLVINSTGTAYTVELRGTDGALLERVKTVSLTQEYPGLTLSPVNDSVVFDGRGLRRSGATRIVAMQGSTSLRDTLTISALGKVNRAR
jgi:prepilin-type N-terminal cleavage/methylation domain-containing protein